MQFTTYAAILEIFLFFSMIWFCQVQSHDVSKRQDARWCIFCCSISLSIDYIWKSSIDRFISTPSRSYCIRNRYCQNNRSILPNFLLFAWFHTVEFNRLPCWKNKIYNNIVLADRSRYPLTMFGNLALIGLSGLLHAHIAYETDTAKLAAAFCRSSYSLHVLIRLNSIV